MKTPLAVLISDIHFNLRNLDLATKSLSKAVEKARDEGCRLLIIAGDLTDHKAMLRAEVVNRLLEIFKAAVESRVDIYLIPGNHDMHHEMSSENSLHFLEPYCKIVDGFFSMADRLCFIPYRHDTSAFLQDFERASPGRIVIAHQGATSANSGDYFVDKSAIDLSLITSDKIKRVISGHYHKAQDLAYGSDGIWSYLGSPYSITFGEADDGPKGFSVLYSDGSLELVPTNLRKHVTITRNVEDVLAPIEGLKQDDLLWMKVEGPYSELHKLKKKDIGATHLGHSNFKLDLMPTDLTATKKFEKADTSVMLDDMIAVSDESIEQKQYLKELWREVLSE